MKRRKDGLYQQELPRDITGGKRKVVYGKTKAEVLRKIADYTEKAESGQTFAAVAEEWWEDAGPKLAAHPHQRQPGRHRRRPGPGGPVAGQCPGDAGDAAGFLIGNDHIGKIA